MSNAINATGAPDPVGPYPHALHVGDFLFLSGVGPRKKGATEIPGVALNANGEIRHYNFEEQCHAVFANVKSVLEAAGGKWEDLVDITVFLTDMKADFATFNKVYAEYFTSHKPCRTTVEVNALPTPIAIELKCIAIVKKC